MWMNLRIDWLKQPRHTNLPTQGLQYLIIPKCPYLSYQKDLTLVIPNGPYTCHIKWSYHLSYQQGLTFVISKGPYICHTKMDVHFSYQNGLINLLYQKWAVHLSHQNGHTLVIPKWSYKLVIPKWPYTWYTNRPYICHAKMTLLFVMLKGLS